MVIESAPLQLPHCTLKGEKKLKTILHSLLLGLILTITGIGMVSAAYAQNNPEQRKTVAAGSLYSSPLHKPQWKRSTVDVTKYSSGSLKVSVTFDRCSGAVQFSEESSFNPNYNPPLDTKPVSLAVKFTKPTKFTIAILATCQPNLVGSVKWAVYLEDGGKKLPEKPCNDEEIQVNYDKKSPKYHHYGPLETQLCLTTNPNCNLSSVFSTMISMVKYVTPVLSSSPVKNCMEIDANPNPLESDLVRIVVNTDKFSITNYTKRKHQFYPGEVRRTIVEKRGAIYVITEGEGTGENKEKNKAIAPALWQQLVDIRLKDGVKHMLLKQRSQ